MRSTTRLPQGALFAAALLSAACSDSGGPGQSARGKIAFGSLRDGDWNVFLADPDGGGLVRLTDDPAVDFHPSLSPDRTKVAFASRRSPAGVYVVNATGGRARLVYAVPGASTRSS